MEYTCDILVVGGGPAGLSAASYAARAGHDTLLIDAAAPGGQLMTIDRIENYPGREDTSGFELAEEMEKQARSFGVRIEYLQALSFSKEGEGRFTANTPDGPIKAKAIILAMGAGHRHLDVPGEAEYEGHGVSYCATCDGPFFRGKDIVVVGGGDTALTDAAYLAKICRKVRLVHRRVAFRAQKALQDRIASMDNIEVVTPHTIQEIQGDGNIVKAVKLDDGSVIETDAVFIFTGITPSSQAAEGFVALDKTGFIITDHHMATDVPGVWACGDIRTTPFRQVVTAAGDGAIAAHMADEYISSL